MREARLQQRSIPLGLGAAPGARATPQRRTVSRPRRRGVQFRVPQARTARNERLDALLPVLENALQAAGYLVLTAAAIVLVFHFAP